MDVITYSCWDLKLNHVSKRGHWRVIFRVVWTIHPSVYYTVNSRPDIEVLVYSPDYPRLTASKFELRRGIWIKTVSNISPRSYFFSLDYSPKFGYLWHKATISFFGLLTYCQIYFAFAIKKRNDDNAGVPNIAAEIKLVWNVERLLFFATHKVSSRVTIEEGVFIQKEVLSQCRNVNIDTISGRKMNIYASMIRQY